MIFPSNNAYRIIIPKPERHGGSAVSERMTARKGRPLKKVLLCALMLLAGSAPADEKTEWPDIGLALGSGGAGGLAHIAMLEVFEDLSVQPTMISGTSIGAIVGVLYAAGMDSSEIQTLFAEFGESALNPFDALGGGGGGVSWTDLVELDFANGSVIDADGFLDFVGERIEARSFSDLAIPVQVVATDYWTGEAVVMEDGDLFLAIKASMAVPGLFAPVADGDRLLIDGGASNPLPWGLVKDQELVVAIDVTGIRTPSPDGPPDLSELLFKTFEIMQQSIITQTLTADRPDLYIKPDLEGVRLLHFDRVDEVVDQARPAAEALCEGLLEAQSAWAGNRAQTADGSTNSEEDPTHE